MKKSCCTKETCRHNQNQDNSSQISDFPGNTETANKGTQMTPNEMSSMSTEKTSMPAPSKTTEKSSEADFNRNNKNINPRQHKTNPSNTSQTSQYPGMYSYPSSTGKPSTSRCLCVNCLHQPTPIHHTTSSSNRKPTKKGKCTCQRPDSSSSSISSMSEHFPFKLKLNVKKRGDPPQYDRYQAPTNLQQRPIVVPSTQLRPERLQPPPIQQNGPSDQYLSINSPTNDNTEEFFSCSSDGPDDDDCSKPGGTCPLPNKVQDAKKNLIILQLLHEVVHLINEDNPITQGDKAMAPQALQPVPSKQSVQAVAPKPETMSDECFCDEGEQMPTNDKPTTSEIKPDEDEPQPIKEPTSPPTDDDICTCPKPTDVCPKHGPIENILKLEPEPSVQEIPICICPNEEIECPLHGRVKPHYTGDDLDETFPFKFIKGQDGDDPYIVEFAKLEEKPHDDQSNNESVQFVPFVDEMEKSPYIVRTSATTGQNVYNFMPEFDIPDAVEDEPNVEEDYFEQLGRYEPADNDYEDEDDEEYFIDYECEEFDIECELAKERQTERYKNKNRGNDRSPQPNSDRTIATLQQMQGDGRGAPAEMKFFIDSLMLDLDAMEHARRKSAVQKNICMPKQGLCPRTSFPVTITDVTDLGTTSLYVKWIIHDCCGIDGYEIFTDGHLTNRYYNGRHESAVITNVDVTIPHKIALVAQPTMEDNSIEQICNPEKNPGRCKSIPWKPDVETQKKSGPAPTSSLWTPSIYLYDPISCKAAAAPPLMRESK